MDFDIFSSKFAVGVLLPRMQRGIKGWVARERAKKKSIKRIIFTNLESCVFLTFTTSFSFFFVVVRTCTLSLQLTFYLSCKYYVVIFYASLFFVFFETNGNKPRCFYDL